jgi:hypothetical protein
MKGKHGSALKIHTCLGPDSHNEQDIGTQSAITNGTPVPSPQQQRWPQGGRRCNLSLAHADARGARTSAKSRRPAARMVVVIPSATGTSRAASTSAPTTGASAHRQIPTRILPDERSTDLHAEAPYRCKGRTALEHERRSSGARCLGRSTRAHGAATTLAAGGAPGAKPASPTRWSWRHPPSTSPTLSKSAPLAGLVSALRPSKDDGHPRS